MRYLQQVEGVRRDVRALPTGQITRPWFRPQAERMGIALPPGADFTARAFLDANVPRAPVFVANRVPWLASLEEAYRLWPVGLVEELTPKDAPPDPERWTRRVDEAWARFDPRAGRAYPDGTWERYVAANAAALDRRFSLALPRAAGPRADDPAVARAVVRGLEAYLARQEAPDAVAHKNLGVAYQLLARSEPAALASAARHFGTALQLNPADPDREAMRALIARVPAAPPPGGPVAEVDWSGVRPLLTRKVLPAAMGVPAETPVDSLYIAGLAEDVLRSCRARLARDLDEGLRIAVLTLFAPLGGSDLDALARAGIDVYSAGLPDAALRHPGRRPLDALVAEPDEVDEDCLARAAAQLLDLGGRTRAKQVYAPLASADIPTAGSRTTRRGASSAAGAGATSSSTRSGRRRCCTAPCACASRRSARGCRPRRPTRRRGRRCCGSCCASTSARPPAARSGADASGCARFPWPRASGATDRAGSRSARADRGCSRSCGSWRRARSSRLRGRATAAPTASSPPTAAG